MIRAGVALLDQDGVRVHRGVVQADPDAEQDQRPGQQGEAHRVRRDDGGHAQCRSAAHAAVTGALPAPPARSTGVTWTARTLPTGTPSSASPRSPSVSPRGPRAPGIRLASVPCTTPEQDEHGGGHQRARRSLGAVGTRAPYAGWLPGTGAPRRRVEP